jgi:hypothetical protein
MYSVENEIRINSFFISEFVWILCYRNDLYAEEYITINRGTGELRTGKDPIDFEQIEVIYYTLVATDGELETPVTVSRISCSLKCDWVLLRYKKQMIIANS